MHTAQLQDKRILVVEDDAMVGLFIEDVLLDAGCLIIGPLITLSAGLTAARGEQFDFAILDVNLAGEKSYPIAEVLEERAIPFVLTSGYADGGGLPGQSNWPTCRKPFASEVLIKKMLELLNR